MGFGDLGAVAGQSFEDFVGGAVPYEGFRVVVAVFDPFVDVGGELSDRVVDPVLELFGGQR